MRVEEFLCATLCCMTSEEPRGSTGFTATVGLAVFAMGGAALLLRFGPEYVENARGPWAETCASVITSRHTWVALSDCTVDLTRARQVQAPAPGAPGDLPLQASSPLALTTKDPERWVELNRALGRDAKQLPLSKSPVQGVVMRTASDVFIVEGQSPDLVPSGVASSFGITLLILASVFLIRRLRVMFTT